VTKRGVQKAMRPPIPSFVVYLASFTHRSQPTLKYKLRQVYLGVGGGAVSRLRENEKKGKSKEKYAGLPHH